MMLPYLSLDHIQQHIPKERLHKNGTCTTMTLNSTTATMYIQVNTDTVENCFHLSHDVDCPSDYISIEAADKIDEKISKFSRKGKNVNSK